MNLKSSSKRLVLLDAHAILHRAYHALPEFSSSSGEPTGGLYGLSSMLIKIIADLKPDYLVAAYDLPKPTYRHEAFKDYKAGRAKADDALVAQMKRSRDVFKAFNIPIYDKEGFEADDIIGTIVEKIGNRQSKIKGNNLDVVIASGDMDTLQLVDGKKVQVYTLKKGINDTVMYDEAGVKERFGFGPELLPDFKGLRGDPSDNIPGIKGIGEVTATTLIKNFGSIEEMYKALKKDKKKFEKAGVKERIVKLLEEGEEEAEFSKMLGTIRRDAPIDFKLPEKRWQDNLDFKSAEELFRELEFRNLGARLKQAVTGASEEKIVAPSAAADGAVQASPSDQISAEENQKMLIALWLINSNLAKPTVDDALNFTKTESLQKAAVLIRESLKDRKLERVWQEIEEPLIPVVEKMNARGIRIDSEYLKNLSKEYHVELAKIEAKVHKLAGAEFNVASPKQLGDILFNKLGLAAKRQKKTSTGAFSTKESELEKLRDQHPIIPLVLEYRELAKLLGTYIDTIPDLVAKDGRLHAQFLQAGTTTGRMGCEDPNLQNIPNKTELGRKIRHAFVSEKSFKLVAFDYSQIELRIAAFLSNDKKLIEIFKKGEDVHTAVASAVFGVSGDKVHPDMRRKAKVINFGVMYGMGVSALKANLGGSSAGAGQVSREDAQKFYNDYFATFSGLAKYLEDVRIEAKKKGYTETYFGRRRYFEGLNSRLPFIRAAAERMAVNAPIQGTEADIVKLAMVKIDQFLKKEKLEEDARLLLQVHDELVYEIKADLVDTLIPKIKAIMEGVIDPKETRGVVCVADVSVGDDWGSMARVRI